MNFRRTYLPRQVAEWIAAELRAGTWRNHLPGERGLAACFGVSRGTVRGALDILAHAGAFRNVNRRRVLVAKPAVASLKNVRKKAVLIIGEMANRLPDSFSLDQRMRHNFDLAGYSLSIESLPLRVNWRESLKKVCEMHRDASVWILGSVPVDVQREMERRQLPALILGSRHSGVRLPDLDANYRALVRHAVNTVWRMGHRRIVYISPLSGYAGDLASEQGFKEALAAMPGGARKARIMRHHGGVSSIRRALDRLFGEADPPTILIVSHACYALTVMGNLWKIGKRIPEDVSLICRDDSPLFRFVVPSVARYGVDRDRLVRRAVQKAVALAEGPSPHPKAPSLRIMPQFIPGDSLADARLSRPSGGKSGAD